MWGKKVKASHKLWNKNTSQDYVTKTWCKNTSQYVMYFYLTRLVWVIFTSQLMQVWCIFTSRLVRFFTSRIEWGIFYFMICMRYFYLTTCVRYFDPTIYVCGKNMMKLKYLTSWEASLGAVPKWTSRQKRNGIIQHDRICWISSNECGSMNHNFSWINYYFRLKIFKKIDYLWINFWKFKTLTTF